MPLHEATSLLSIQLSLQESKLSGKVVR